MQVKKTRAIWLKRNLKMVVREKKMVRMMKRNMKILLRKRSTMKVAKERRKRKEYEVFVGGLDKDATEEDLKKVFSVVGEITEVRLMMNPQTKKNKGFAFLRFATVEKAKRAVSELKSPMVNGKQCGVAPSQDNDKLFLGNICKTWTKEALKEKLKHYGIENVEDLNLVEDTINEGMNCGFAFLEFPSRLDAMDAYKREGEDDAILGIGPQKGAV
ncbi:heterogeneous nuclear ribonucleoprotein Q-like [Magnolia sinica]|uniref:heterogeneous nuclear ribonucleoprotein Q-like n=1 Tax=Magnolia sinica TaxID=86752 RepID=UPI0026597513|nr:heterogeneous nuclear ribonucleoprotein Q-like [Magnolia sinica]